MRKLVQNACIHRFVVEYKCSGCGRKFPVGLHKHVTGGTYGPPPDVEKAFHSHVCDKEHDEKPTRKRKHKTGEQ